MSRVLSFRNPFVSEGLRTPIYVKQMRDQATYAGKDIDGNDWYLSKLLSEFTGFSRSTSNNNKVDFDMSLDTHKRIALSVCTPLSTVLNRCGNLSKNGRFYIQDKDGNEPSTKEAKDIRKLLLKPNFFQSGRQFLKQVETTLKLFGYCPVFTLRATKGSTPISMIVIPPELFHQKTTGKLWMQSEISEVIGKTYIDWNGKNIDLEEEDYFVISDSEVIFHGQNSDLEYRSESDSLTHPVNNWMAQIIGRGTLIKHGGPKGIISNDDSTEFQNAAMTKDDKEELNGLFKSKYGIVNKLFSVWVTQKKIKWTPLSFNVGELKLHEEDVACQSSIANAIGLDPSIFSADSKYDNKDAAKKSAYQDLIIPDSDNISESLTEALCPDGLFVKIDYSHVACLQSDKQAESSTLVKVSTSFIKLVESGLISKDEARIELSKYLDINPAKKIENEKQ